MDMLWRKFQHSGQVNLHIAKMLKDLENKLAYKQQFIGLANKNGRMVMLD